MDATRLYDLRARVVAYLDRGMQMDVAMLGSLVLLLVVFCWGRKSSPRVQGAPFHGYRSWFEPTFWLQIRFTTGAHDIISSAYKKFKNVPFVLRRYDADITILPMKYLDELRTIPRTKLSGKKALVDNLVPRWTWTQVMMESDLHVKVLSGKLNPDIHKYIDMAHSELEHGWSIEMPQPSSVWSEVDIQQSMRMLVARMSARIFMGSPVCRASEWLKLSVDFSSDLFIAAFTLRMFPPWMHPFVAHFVPARWRIRKQMALARKFVADLTREHVEAKENGVEPQDTLLAWMLDHGTEKERTVGEMAARQCVLTLASIHTTSMSVSNLLFDLCAHPEWFPVLQDEIDQVIREHGPLKESSLTAKQWLSKLEKMDSLIMESQRVNPPILLNPQRIALAPLALKDGTVIPAGTKIAWAGYHHNKDPSIIDDPEKFDPMRSYRKRYMDDGANLNRFTAGQISSSNLSFGYGNQACPGRYFAIGEIKMVLMKLLLEFEFKLPGGQSRPKTLYADENVFIDPHAKVMMRKRNRGTEQ